MVPTHCFKTVYATSTLSNKQPPSVQQLLLAALATKYTCARNSTQFSSTKRAYFLHSARAAHGVPPAWVSRNS